MKVISMSDIKKERSERVLEELEAERTKTGDTSMYKTDGIEDRQVLEFISDDNRCVAFADIMHALRQMSTDAEVTIKIDADGIQIDSLNSVPTTTSTSSVQTNLSLTKQVYIHFYKPNQPENFQTRDEFTANVRHALSALVMYSKEDDDD